MFSYHHRLLPSPFLNLFLNSGQIQIHNHMSLLVLQSKHIFEGTAQYNSGVSWGLLTISYFFYYCCYAKKTYVRLKCKHRTTFRRKRRLQNCPQSRLMTNLARPPKSPIFWDFEKRAPRENRSKCRPTSGVSNEARRKPHDMLISMRLKCKHRTTFRHKRRLQNCPQHWVMTNLARAPKSPIFWDFAKGGTKENRPKCRPTSETWKKARRKLHDILIN